MVTWSEIKTAINTLYPQYVGSGKLIDDTDNGSTPSPLAILVDLVHNRITGKPGIELNCLQETGTITLTGATTYNLRTLFPGLKTVRQLYGINSYQDHTVFDNPEANITPLDGWTVRGNNLVFTGTAPSGTATIQYKSGYMVKETGGTRQKYFLAESDYTVLDDDDVNLLICGVGEYINWNSDSESQDRRKEVKEWFREAWENLMFNNPISRSVSSLL